MWDVFGSPSQPDCGDNRGLCLEQGGSWLRLVLKILPIYLNSILPRIIFSFSVYLHNMHMNRDSAWGYISSQLTLLSFLHTCQLVVLILLHPKVSHTGNLCQFVLTAFEWDYVRPTQVSLLKGKASKPKLERREKIFFSFAERTQAPLKQSKINHS